MFGLCNATWIVTVFRVCLRHFDFYFELLLTICACLFVIERVEVCWCVVCTYVWVGHSVLLWCCLIYLVRFDFGVS